jgi:hypothetical protein
MSKHRDRNVTVVINVILHDGPTEQTSEVIACDVLGVTIPGPAFSAVDWNRFVQVIYQRAGSAYAEKERQQQAANTFYPHEKWNEAS